MQVKVSLPGELVARLDVERGDVSRSVWVRRALESRLDRESRRMLEPPPLSGALERTYDDMSQGARDARVAMAEQPVTPGHLATCRCAVCTAT